MTTTAQEIARRDAARRDASYVLDWLRSTRAPKNIIELQERAVAALGGYADAKERAGGRLPWSV